MEFIFGSDEIRFMAGSTCHIENDFKDFFFLFRNRWIKHLYYAYKIVLQFSLSNSPKLHKCIGNEGSD